MNTKRGELQSEGSVPLHQQGLMFSYLIGTHVSSGGVFILICNLSIYIYKYFILFFDSLSEFCT